MKGFSAIDVETANAQRASICAVGIVHVEDGRIVGRHKWLVKPPDGFEEFRGFNIGIHGIHARDVADAPTFASIVPTISAELLGRHVVAHNASFDISAIAQACQACGAELPSFAYSCTMQLCRHLLDLPSYSLPFCANALGVPLGEHHDPTADAEMSALIALALLDREKVDSLDLLVDRILARPGQLSPTTRGHRHAPRSRTTPSANELADSTNPLFGQGIVITGDLVCMTRQAAFDRIAELGATPQKSVGFKTTILVVGDLNPATLLPGESGTSKTRKAFELQAAGQRIEVMSAYDFLPMLD